MTRPFDSEFHLDDGFIHLNHAAVAPWPQRTVDAVTRFAQENLHQGSWDYPKWLQTESTLRTQLATLINAPSADDIALVKNTSEALSFVAAGVDWRHGDNIVTSDQEFPSNRIVWEALSDNGVELRQARLYDAESPEDALFQQVDNHTRLIAISSVQYASGLRMDLERIGQFCRDRNILFCVDAIQSIGAVDFDAQTIHADFVAADGHKWMLGPEGLGFFYVRREIRDLLKLSQFGWHMVEAVGEFDQREWQPAHSARRFECGSPNMLGIHALSASLSLLLEVGMDKVESQVLENSRYLLEELASLPNVQCITPAQSSRHAGIISFCFGEKNHESVHNYLNEQRIFCASRGGAIRFSPHFYTPSAQLQYAIDAVRTYISHK